MNKMSRTSEAYEALKTDILNGVYPPRQKLGIDQIAKSMSVSPGAIREALARLTSDSLVVAQPQKGFVVAPISIEDLADLTEVRIEVETQCLVRSIQNGDLDWESRVVAAHHRLDHLPMFANGKSGPSSTGSTDEWADAHIKFHDAIVSACDSEWWFRLRKQLFYQVERYRRLTVPYTKIDRDISTEHRKIMEACLGRDTSLAVKLLSEHMQLTATLLTASDAPFDDASRTKAAPKNRDKSPIRA